MFEFYNGFKISLVVFLFLSGCSFLQEDKKEEAPNNEWFDHQISYLDTLSCSNISFCGQEKKVLNHYELWSKCDSGSSCFDNVKEAELYFIGKRFNSLLKSGYQKKIIDELQSLHGCSINLPADFKVVKQKKDFFWARNVFKKYDSHIWVYKGSYKNQTQLETSALLSLRDSVLKRHFLFKKYDSTSYAGTERYFVPQNDQVYWKSKYAQRIQGAWKIAGNRASGKYMGGPFVGYVLIPENDPKEFFYIEAFFSAPNRDKLPFIRTLEAILSTFKGRDYEYRF